MLEKNFPFFICFIYDSRLFVSKTTEKTRQTSKNLSLWIIYDGILITDHKSCQIIAATALPTCPEISATEKSCEIIAATTLPTYPKIR